MGQCLSRADSGDGDGLVAVRRSSEQPRYAGKDAGQVQVDTKNPRTAEQPAEEFLDLTKPGEVPNAVVNPDTDMILNILDPVTGPASGLPYQVHYLGPPRPPCEAERLATVSALGKLGSNAPDPEINTILKLVASVFKAPAALCALFDEKQVFVSEQEGNIIPCGEFPWRWTLCGWSMAFKNAQILVIQDTMQDVRFSNNEKCKVFPKVRFYCGAPLIASNGHRLGTLCFADVKPRKFDMASCLLMNNMSELVVRQLEKDLALKLKEKANKTLAATYSHLQRAIDCFETCVALVDVTDGWKVVYTNAAWSKLTGLNKDKLVGNSLSDALECTDGTSVPSKQHCELADKQKAFNIRLARVRNPNVTKTFSLSFKPAGKMGLDDSTIAIGVPSWLPVEGGDDQVSKKFYFVSINPPGSGGSKSSVSAPMSSAAHLLSISSDCGVMEGLDLGHLLGRGSFGSVYLGTYFGTQCAVKIIDEDVRSKPAETSGGEAKSMASSVQCPGTPNKSAGANVFTRGMSETGASNVQKPHMEALLAHELRHPYIVGCLKWMTHTVPKARLCLEANTSSCPYQGFLSTSGVDPSMTPVKTPGQAAWAVMEMPEDGMFEDGDAQDHEGHLSEESRMIQQGCQVQGDGWKGMVMGEAPAVPAAAGSKEHQLEVAHSSQSRTGAVSSTCHNSDASAVIPSSSSDVLHQTWLVMEFCDRGCVQDAVDRGWLRTTRDSLTSKPNMEAVVQTCVEIASALCYLHAHDIVHGDLSGWNVMLSSSGTTANIGGRGWVAKVADFGLARAMEQQSSITTRNYGTITHMPCELLTGGTLSKATDVYSFGVLMWQMYTGSRPWSGLTHGQIIMKVVQQKAQLQWGEDTPCAYKTLAQLCMSHDMEERPTFADISETLDAMKSAWMHV